MSIFSIRIKSCSINHPTSGSKIEKTHVLFEYEEKY